ncbi:GGDEF domain-containing protein [Flocculibacter collagenilyticus]|uniref:GGDEF domain-containing protein n=1 Tax=Flocculibacter collagenilyticus TaxID=2744479 RepID=UPI0018F4621A|nr:diguanylate cyclase [Flocculibacter collagenilyticus]
MTSYVAINSVSTSFTTDATLFGFEPYLFIGFISALVLMTVTQHLRTPSNNTSHLLTISLSALSAATLLLPSLSSIQLPYLDNIKGILFALCIVTIVCTAWYFRHALQPELYDIQLSYSTNVSLFVWAILAFSLVLWPTASMLTIALCGLIISACIMLFISYRLVQIGHQIAHYFYGIWFLTLVFAVVALAMQLQHVQLGIMTHLVYVYLAILNFSCIAIQYMVQQTQQETHQRTHRELEEQLQQQNFELQETLRELESKNQILEEKNTLDALTGIKNRRYFDQKIMQEYRRCRREQTQLSVVMLDIDHFKRINDNFGHLAGDEVIKQVANIAKATLKRPSDDVCRYGGEEFCLILPSTELEGAWQVAEEIRKNIESLEILTNSGNISVTISCGVASSKLDAESEVMLLIDNADHALYQSKQQGRNQTTLFQKSALSQQSLR